MKRYKDSIIISCTSRDKESFKRTFLGHCLENHSFDFKEYIIYKNLEGLSRCYNESVKLNPNFDYYIFCHDDIYINETSTDFSNKIRNMMIDSDVLGIAGTSSYNIQQNNLWHLSDRTDISVHIEQSDLPNIPNLDISENIRNYYSTRKNLKNSLNCPKRVVILDGCFLVVKNSVFFEKNVWFDEQFTFHHYDMDFCLTCNNNQIKLSTMKLDLTHLSPGLFSLQNPYWATSNQKFINKWKMNQ